MRFLDWRGISIGCVIVAGFLAYWGYTQRSVIRFDLAIAGAVACVDADNATLCAKPYVQELLDMQTGTAVMEALAQELPPSQCHYIGHVVGQQSYQKFQNLETALGQCDRSCDSACWHGIIGETFAQELGSSMDGVLEVQHLSVDDIREVGKRLCSSTEACHGVGHTLFAIYKEFTPALAMCREVASENSVFYCYQGLFMEYADILSQRNMGPAEGVVVPTADTVANVCADLPTFEERRACFRYFPRMAVQTYRNAGMSERDALAKLREVCRTYPDKDNSISCLVGLGVYASYSVLGDPNDAVDRCERFPTPLEQASCHLGQISVATQDRKERVTTYCASIPDDRRKRSCYQGVFFFLNRLGTTREEAEQLCGDDICRGEIGNYALDPWDELRALYE